MSKKNVFEKYIISLFIIFFLVSCGTKKNEKNINITTKENINVEEQKEPEEIITDNLEKTIEEKLGDIKLDGEEYGDLKEYIKKDLDIDDKQAILGILEDRKTRQKEIKEILEKSIIDGDFKEKMKEVKNLRNICQLRILTYVIESKKDKFIKICNSGNVVLEAKYISKMSKIKNHF